MVPVLPLTPKVKAYPGGSSLPGGGSSSSGHEAAPGFCKIISTCFISSSVVTGAAGTDLGRQDTESTGFWVDSPVEGDHFVDSLIAWQIEVEVDLLGQLNPT